MTDRTLLDIPAVPKLTDRQATAYRLIQSAPSGLTSSALGAAIHGERGCDYCTDTPCQYAKATGVELGNTLRKKGLVRKRRDGGLWQALTPAPDPDAYDPTTAPIPF